MTFWYLTSLGKEIVYQIFSRFPYKSMIKQPDISLYKQSKKQLAEASTRSRSHIYDSINWLVSSNFLNLENIELEQHKVLVSRFFKTNYDIVPALFFF